MTLECASDAGESVDASDEDGDEDGLGYFAVDWMNFVAPGLSCYFDCWGVRGGNEYVHRKRRYFHLPNTNDEETVAAVANCQLIVAAAVGVVVAVAVAIDANGTNGERQLCCT